MLESGADARVKFCFDYSCQGEGGCMERYLYGSEKIRIQSETRARCAFVHGLQNGDPSRCRA